MQTDKWLMWFLVCHNPHHSTLPLYHGGQAPGGTHVCGLIIGSSGHMSNHIQFSLVRPVAGKHSHFLPSHSYSPAHLRKAPSTPSPPSTAPTPMPPKLHSPTGGHTPTSHGRTDTGRHGRWSLGRSSTTSSPTFPKTAQSPALQRTSAPPWTRHSGTAQSPWSLWHKRPVTSQHSI